MKIIVPAQIKYLPVYESIIIHYAYNKGNNIKNMRYENQTIGEKKNLEIKTFQIYEKSTVSYKNIASPSSPN